MKLTTINLTNFGVGQFIWILYWKEVLVEPLDGSSKFYASAVGVQKVKMIGVWLGIEDEEEVNIFSVEHPDIEGEILEVRKIFFTELFANKELELLEL